MPPKKAIGSAEDVDGPAVGAVTALSGMMGARVKRALRYVIAGSVQQANTDLGIALQCHLVMSCDEFKADNAKLADILGISQARNVPRKINSFINPYGFELKGGKIVLQSDSQAQDGAAGSNSNTSAAEDGKDAKMKKAPKVPKLNAKARQGPSKKRKLAVCSPDEDGSDHVKEEDG